MTTELSSLQQVGVVLLFITLPLLIPTVINFIYRIKNKIKEQRDIKLVY
jgi:hypothetical protein